MSDPTPPQDDDRASGVHEVDAALLALLSAPATWEDPASHLEDAVVAAIAAEAGHDGDAADAVRAGDEVRAEEGEHLPPASASPPRLLPVTGGRRRPALIGAVAGVAAAVVLFLVAIGLDVVDVDRPGGEAPATVEVALEAVDGGPAGARADAAFQDLPDGTRIELGVTGLPGAQEGQWYEMRLLRPDLPPVSAGTFHLRGGGGRVVLWAGIGVQADVVVEITLQPHGTPVLTGRP